MKLAAIVKNIFYSSLLEETWNIQNQVRLEVIQNADQKLYSDLYSNVEIYHSWNWISEWDIHKSISVEH